MDEQLKIGDVAGVVTQMLSDDKTKTTLFAKIDEAIECIFEPDAAIQDLPYIKNRHFGKTDIADARNTGVRTFATLMPDIQIAPLNDDQQEYERTEMAEQAWAWEFERMNRTGKKSIHEQIMEDAMSYHAVALQTEYLPYAFKDRLKDNRLKAILSQKYFNWTRHHPGLVHSRESKYTTEAVAKVCPYNLQTLIEEFGTNNEGVAKLKNKHANAKLQELLSTYYVLVDYCDWENRVQFAVPGSGQTVPTVVGDSDIVFMNEKHGLGFLPWVIVDKGDPIWKSVINSGIWENSQYVAMLRFAKVIELHARATLIIKTPDGTLQRVWMDFSNPSNPIVLPLDGSDVSPLQPAPIDQGVETIYMELNSTIASSTVSQILRDTSRFANAPFSSVNQMINIAMGQLARAKNAAGDAEALAIYQGFQWIKHSLIPFTSYRNKDKDSRVDGNEYNRRGGQIIISPAQAPTKEEFEKMDDEQLALEARTVRYDLDALYVTVELRSNNTTDEQSRINVNLNAVQNLGASGKWAWERMGWENYDMVRNQRREEMLEDAELQKEIKIIQADAEAYAAEKMAQAQARVQAQAQAEAAAQQQQAQATQNNANAGGSQPTMPGQDMRGGMNPAAMANPQGTREMITGQARNGGQVQR
jgi:hypothetical protein